jgi:ribosomal protein S18 acetylase RimI-like enzyme|tara:strand:+ start:594 stop:1103 length:510 start_codon:yes stop_codon:yes gene_type:complete
MEKITRNYLEINSLNELSEVKKPNSNLKLEKISSNDFQLNKFFYKQIGKNHNWTDRLSWTDKNWIKYVSNPNLFTYVLKNKEEVVGYFEIIYHCKIYEAEIAYFGILEEYLGKRIGGYMLSEAIKKSFIKNTKRTWVHTCSLDHKNALNNYLARGMKIYNSEIVNIKSA